MRRYSQLLLALMIIGLLFLGTHSPVYSTGKPTAESTTEATKATLAHIIGKIAFVSEVGSASQLYIMNADGSNIRQLTNDNRVSWSPVLSPNGKQIAFAAMVDKHYQIFSMNIDGSNEKQLTHNATGQSGISGIDWSRDGKQIVFAYKASDDPNVQSDDLYVINVDGSNQRNITHHVMKNLFSPHWSPDGKQIVFNSDASSPNARPNPSGSKIKVQIFIINVDGSNLHRLTQGDNNELSPAWSPDGKWIVFLSSGETIGGMGLYRVGPDGTAPMKLTDSTYFMPTWSPDGKYLAAVLSELKDGKTVQNIYVMNADGSNPIKITDTNDRHDLPTWAK